MSEYTKQGGKWLAAARSWMQHHCHNGSTVAWGSNEVLNPPLTVADVEEIAAKVAEAMEQEVVRLKAELDYATKARIVTGLDYDYKYRF